MNKIFALLFSLLLFVNVFAQKSSKDYTRHVDPFVGTGGHGHTFPGATAPFGAVQLSPDTRVDNWDGSSGYHYSDDLIYGFSHTHLSGTGIPDYCDVLFAPYVSENDYLEGNSADTKNGYASRFSHAEESAAPGYYAVKLKDENIYAEMTTTARAGFHRYTFPQATENAKLTLDLKWRDKVLYSEIEIVGDRAIAGVRASESWAKKQIVYFYAEFSKPFAEAKIAADDKFTNGRKASGKNLKSVVRFDVAANEKILVKVGISAVSPQGAEKNLKTEIPGWDFEKTRADAKFAWNRELSQIEVAGGTREQLTNFYTALYHTKIQPNVFSDVDGNYVGLDKEVHDIKDHSVSSGGRILNGRLIIDTGGGYKSFPLADAQISENYTVFSLWDTFRAAHPLYTITDQKRTADFINTFIRQYKQGGRLPVWELAGNETDTMIGYHAVSVIADAMAKGIKGFDYQTAYEAAKHSAELNHFGLEAYKRRGYISMEDEHESVSKTLEYAYNDFCIAQMARQLAIRSFGGLPSPYFSDYDKYIRRAQYYKNLYDRESGFMRPKQNGNWIAPFQPNEVTFHFTEGNSWVYSFFVPHDVSGLMELHGGRANFIKKLDELFATEQKLAGRFQPDITGLIGQYAHGNEPSHHIAYLYDYAGEPWKTQKLVRRILDEFYKPAPDGLIGNEDCGQMSAWYILSALGFYQVNPSQPVYAFGAPLFGEAKIRLENGKTFTIRAANVSNKNIYIQSVKLNGKAHKKSFFTHEDLMSGGTLEFTMTDKPHEQAFAEFPVSRIENSSPIVPTIEAPRVFKDRTEVKISLPRENAKIFYSLGGAELSSRPIEYTEPFTVDATTIVKAYSVDAKGVQSLPVESKLNKIPHDWTIEVLSKYNRQYTAGGDVGLIDGIRGTLNFASGEWQGYQPDDLVAVIDLQRETEIRRLGGGFLQDARPWIWMPTRIEFEVSDDNRNFRKVASIKTDVAIDDMKPQIRDYVREIAPVKARYVRVRAYNSGKIPAWHPGAGDDAFIFVDEIIIE
ncbi:MAG TPA: GH92 family glycosyl hydrolase [Pyrinomonadaceae bacterium]|jgi:putative alpha-1,2-mannosidase